VCVYAEQRRKQQQRKEEEQRERMRTAVLEGLRTLTTEEARKFRATKVRVYQ
jgi:hypothetical protein